MGVTAAATTQSSKIHLGSPKFEKYKENFLSLIVPCPSGNMHSPALLYPIVISYMIHVIFLCDKHSPMSDELSVAVYLQAVVTQQNCSFALQLAEDRADKALCGLLTAKLECNVGLVPEENVDRRWLNLRLLHGGRQISSSAVSDLDSNFVFQLVKK